MQPIFDTRHQYAIRRNNELMQKIESQVANISLPNLAIFTVGSYGRLEASEYSDVDLFFTYDAEEPSGGRRTNEYRLFGRLIDIVEELGYPPLSNDAEFLQAHSLNEMLKHLGSPEDDQRNYFTSRMLLLLESRPLYGHEAYDRILDRIVETYHRDLQGHENEFRPWFLLNDVMRFWKTLLLNYEHKRNEGDDETLARSRVKNFKLKYSRATTCFATIAAIGSTSGPVDVNTIKEIVALSPRERLERVAEDNPDLQQDVDAALADYAWFLEQTGKPTADLRTQFADAASRRDMFARADAYTARLYDVLRGIDRNGDGSFLRSLVV